MLVNAEVGLETAAEVTRVEAPARKEARRR